MVDDVASGDAAASAGFKVADRIQNTLIGQAITAAQVEKHVADAQRIGFNAITVPGCWVGFARELLRRNGSAGIVLGAILDFPYGSATTAERVAGAAALVAAGVAEIDATVHIGLALSGRRTEFSADLVAVVEAARPVPVKFMLELPLLTAPQRDFVVDAAVAAGAAFVKNASRGAVGIADVAQISYLRKRVPDSVGVKASGGIRTLRQVHELLDAGADLIGTSAGVAIVTGTRTAGDSLDAY
ncbi:MAG: deoxyribose-phosphate aldolase [Actinobacteria bacterium 69-20]|nr:deoxyribose-phosphate aldolase [Actinomycetota bacterium]OJV24728.1 MAG: deoxyribose-phosphate aldolase [Actinobacteria bacterium 69-20]